MRRFIWWINLIPTILLNIIWITLYIATRNKFNKILMVNYNIGDTVTTVSKLFAGIVTENTPNLIINIPTLIVIMIIMSIISAVIFIKIVLDFNVQVKLLIKSINNSRELVKLYINNIADIVILEIIMIELYSNHISQSLGLLIVWVGILGIISLTSIVLNLISD